MPIHYDSIEDVQIKKSSSFILILSWNCALFSLFVCFCLVLFVLFCFVLFCFVLFLFLFLFLFFCFHFLGRICLLEISLHHFIGVIWKNTLLMKILMFQPNNSKSTQNQRVAFVTRVNCRCCYFQTPSIVHCMNASACAQSPEFYETFTCKQ